MIFNLKDLHTKELVTAHQTFIRLVHQKTGQEIFFVAEADESDNYKFTLVRHKLTYFSTTMLYFI